MKPYKELVQRVESNCTSVRHSHGLGHCIACVYKLMCTHSLNLDPCEGWSCVVVVTKVRRSPQLSWRCLYPGQLHVCSLACNDPSILQHLSGLHKHIATVHVVYLSLLVLCGCMWVCGEKGRTIRKSGLHLIIKWLYTVHNNG